MPIPQIKDTFQHATQNMVLQSSLFLRRQFRSFWPFMNFPRRIECDSSDMIYANAKCHTTGCDLAHLFTGSVSKVTDAFGFRDRSSTGFLSSFQQRVVRGEYQPILLPIIHPSIKANLSSSICC